MRIRGRSWFAEGRGRWDGGAQRHGIAATLKTMKVGDLVFFYHSNIGKEIVGPSWRSPANIIPDHTDTTGDVG